MSAIGSLNTTAQEGLASTAPEILMAHIAAHTTTLRTGSGGILLPQYSPFKVAEVTRQLEALYPDGLRLVSANLQAGLKGRGSL